MKPAPPPPRAPHVLAGLMIFLRVCKVWETIREETLVCEVVCGGIRHMLYDVEAFVAFCCVEHFLHASPNNLWILRYASSSVC
jgi:hypothetical protein